MKDKMTFGDVVLGICRVLGGLVFLFWFYNLALYMAGAMVYALMLVMDKIMNSTLGVDVIAQLFGLAEAYPVAAVIVYICGFLVFMWLFIKRFTDAAMKS